MRGQSALVTLKRLSKLDDFIDVMSDPEHNGLTLEQIGIRFEITENTIRKLMTLPEISDVVTENQELIMRAQTYRANAALLKAIDKEDTKAIDIFYREFKRNPKDSESNFNGARKVVDENGYVLNV